MGSLSHRDVRVSRLQTSTVSSFYCSSSPLAPPREKITLYVIGYWHTWLCISDNQINVVHQLSLCVSHQKDPDGCFDSKPVGQPQAPLPSTCGRLWPGSPLPSSVVDLDLGRESYNEKWERSWSRGHDGLANCVRVAMSESVNDHKTFVADNAIYWD